MIQKLKQRKEGFTIIEVLIVLAIAGLILLIVFLAVPALQRNARNTGRKSDIASILGAVSEYGNNNGGALPATNLVFSTAFASSAPKLGYYTTPANITWTNPAAAAAPADPANLDKVVVTSYSKCNGSASTTTGATARSVVALYDVEGSGGAIVAQCQESGS